MLSNIFVKCQFKGVMKRNFANSLVVMTSSLDFELAVQTHLYFLNFVNTRFFFLLGVACYACNFSIVLECFKFKLTKMETP